MKIFHSISKKRRSAIVVGVISIVSIMIPLLSLFHTEFFRVHDFTQGARVIEMFRGFQDGQIPVRWSQNFGFGYGMPTFLFYAPFPYIVGAAIYWFSQDLVFSLRIIWALPTIFSFLGMYLFTKKYLGKWGALIAAVSFTLAPYRAVDLYVRGAIGEVWGIAFFPWLLIAVDDWFDNPRLIDPKLSLLTGLLLITHNLMAMFFLPVLVVYGLLKLIVGKKIHFKILLLFFIQILIGIGISAFFILPALVEQNETQIQSRILSGYFSYVQHFVYIRQFFQENWKYGGSVWGPFDDISFFLGYGQLMGGVLLGIVTLYWLVRKSTQLKRPIHFLKRLLDDNRELLPITILATVFFPVSLFLCVQKSEFFWKLSTLLQAAQFPWRFLSLTVFSLAILNGLIFRFVLPKYAKPVLFFTLFIVLVIPSFKYFRPERFLDESIGSYYTDAHLIRFKMSETWPDFLPINFNGDITPTDERFTLPVGSNPKEVEVLIDRTSQLALQTHFAAPALVTLNIADFPGWTVFIDGQEVTTTQNRDGLLQLTVPIGEHLLSAELERTPIRLIADIITVCSLSILIGGQIILFRKKEV
ncbi:MAG: hypothetical protein ABI425_01045 [Patescibacteria group bacterium]